MFSFGKIIIMLAIKYVKSPIPALKNEEWAVLKLNTNREYFISTKGRLFSTYSNRLLKLRSINGDCLFDYVETEKRNPLPSGRKELVKKKYTISSKRSKITVQRLVALTFIPRPSNCNVVIHLDFNKGNNKVENLKWVTQSEALAYARTSPKYRMNRRYGLGKLKVKDVVKIKEMLSKKRLKISEIAAKFGVSEMQIFRIQNGTNWSHVPGFSKPKTIPNLLSKKEVRKVKNLLSAGYTGVEISKKTNISVTTISKIKNKKIYK